jgi:hypothetical protein
VAVWLEARAVLVATIGGGVLIRDMCDAGVHRIQLWYLYVCGALSIEVLCC